MKSCLHEDQSTDPLSGGRTHGSQYLTKITKLVETGVSLQEEGEGEELTQTE